MEEKPKSLDEVDPELLRTYEKLGIPLKEQMILAGRRGRRGCARRGPQGRRGRGVRQRLRRHDLPGGAGEGGRDLLLDLRGDQEHPELVKKYLGSVVPITDNFFATLNSAVFSDGSFVYVPPGVRCPMELSTYFRINAENTGQFERTLIIADKGSMCQLSRRLHRAAARHHQLHAAVVELVALDDAEIKYSTVQNWYPGRRERQGRHLQLRHQARRLPGRPVQGDVDAGGNRLGHHVEIPVLHPARR
jgi:Fe-S cluster assembly protein SufB